MLLTWNPVNRTPVSKEVVALAVWIIRAFFSSLASSSYNLVPSLISRIFGFKNLWDRFSNTIECIVVMNTRRSPHAFLNEDTYLFPPLVAGE